jgi:hypothetical protein
MTLGDCPERTHLDVAVEGPHSRVVRPEADRHPPEREDGHLPDRIHLIWWFGHNI